jgi:hypothetical protein
MKRSRLPDALGESCAEGEELRQRLEQVGMMRGPWRNGEFKGNFKLVGGLEHLFFHILGMSSSQLTFKFFKMVKTTNQNIMEVFPAANTFRLFLGVWFM